MSKETCYSVNRALTFENVRQGAQDEAQSEDGRRHAAGAGGADVLLMCC